LTLAGSCERDWRNTISAVKGVNLWKKTTFGSCIFMKRDYLILRKSTILIILFLMDVIVELPTLQLWRTEQYRLVEEVKLLLAKFRNSLSTIFLLARKWISTVSMTSSNIVLNAKLKTFAGVVLRWQSA